MIYDLQESDDGVKPKPRHHSFELVQYVLYAAALKSSFILSLAVHFLVVVPLVWHFFTVGTFALVQLTLKIEFSRRILFYFNRV